MAQSETIADERVVARLQELLKTVDLQTTTERQLRKALEKEFNEDLSSKKDVIRAEVTRYLDEQDAQAESDAEAKEEEPASEAAASRAVNGAEKDRDPQPVRKKRKAGAFGKSFLSSEMQEFLGEESLPRTQVVKRLWEYIKEKNLQNPQNKRKIILDERLSTLFKPPLDMFNMNKQISRHCKQDDRETVDDDDEIDDAPAPKKVKQQGTGGKKGKQKNADKGNEPKTKRVVEHKKVPLSQAMGDWYGAPQCTRPELIQHFWKYVKEKELQDPADKKFILADDVLFSLTRERRFSGFSFTKLMQPHVLPS